MVKILSVFSLGTLQGMRASTIQSSLFHLLVFPVASLWVWIQAFIFLHSLLCSGHSLEVFPCSLSSMPSYTIFWAPFLTHFQPKIRNKIQQYSLWKKVICACVLQIKFWDDDDGWNIATKNPWTTFTT